MGSSQLAREPRLQPIHKPLPSLESRSTTSLRKLSIHDTEADKSYSVISHHQQSHSDPDNRTTNQHGNTWPTRSLTPLHGDTPPSTDRSGAEEPSVMQRLQPVKSAKGGRMPNFHVVKETAI